jgi:hypothetical protein
MTPVGSPVYDILPAHLAAVWALALLPIAAWLFARVAGAADEGSLSRRLVDGYGALAGRERVITWLMLATAAIHLGLAVDPEHAGTGLRVAFVAQAVLLAIVVARLALGRSWRRPAVAVLAGSVVAYWMAMVGGEAPDQLGLATKLVEIAAIALIIRPAPGRPVRGLLVSALVISLVVLTDVAAWAGAVVASGGVDAAAGVASHQTGHDPAGHGDSDGEGETHSHEEGHGHGHGAVPAPGMLMVPDAGREPTTAERAAATATHDAVVRGIARYADPVLAAADGYQTDGITGTDFHAGNAAYEHDGRILDPERPETLVYASGPQGRPILLGAMFLMERMGDPGPTIGGPLTIWHAHEHICFSLVPPAMTGILSPLGSCPIGSLDLPVSAEMIHVWTVPGAPNPFGDLDPEWLDAYLRSVGA